MNKRIGPNFMVIGATRSGTSWLYEILKTHPEVYLPNNVKEIEFFNRHYEKGLDWYLSFFPKTNMHRAVGECSADYLFCRDTPDRIKEVLPNTKFIITLRNPIDKVFSSYKLERSYKGIKESFEDYIGSKPRSFQKAFYSSQLNRWFSLFPKEQFLVLIFEETIQNPEAALKKIADFLGVSDKSFSRSAMNRKENASYTPLCHGLFLKGIRFNDYLISKEQYALSKIFVKAGSLFRVLPKKDAPKMSPETRRVLYETFEHEIQLTERVLGINLDIWKRQEEQLT